MREQTVCIITCSSVYLIKLFSFDSLAEVNLNYLLFEFKNSADWHSCRTFLMYQVFFNYFFSFSKSHGVGQTRRNAFNPQRWYFEFANAKTGNTDSGKLLFIPLFF